MDKDPGQSPHGRNPLRKSFQKLEIEDGEQKPRFWKRLVSRIRPASDVGRSRKPAVEGRTPPRAGK